MTPLPPAGESAPPAATGRARARGRAVAVGIYYLLVAAIILAAAVQVVTQLFFQPVKPSPYAGCRQGLVALVRAVERAREAAPGTDGEDAAVARFRSGLEPEWGYRDGIAATCRGSAGDERALDAIERLRYAEEHAARREAGDLAPLRRRVRAIVDGELGPAPSP